MAYGCSCPTGSGRMRHLSSATGLDEQACNSSGSIRSRSPAGGFRRHDRHQDPRLPLEHRFLRCRSFAGRRPGRVPRSPLTLDQLHRSSSHRFIFSAQPSSSAPCAARQLTPRSRRLRGSRGPVWRTGCRCVTTNSGIKYDIISVLRRRRRRRRVLMQPAPMHVDARDARTAVDRARRAKVAFVSGEGWRTSDAVRLRL